MKDGHLVAIVLACWLLSACGGNSTTPAIDDPRVLKHVFDLGGTSATSGEYPNTILAVETTIAEINVIDARSSYSPSNADLNDSVYYFVFSGQFAPNGPGSNREFPSVAWATAILETDTGKLLQRTYGSSYLHHPDLSQISVPRNLASIDVDPAKLIPAWGQNSPTVTPAPPATSAPAAPQ